MPNNKREITKRLLELIPDTSGVSQSLDQALNTWYMNIRESGGLRLTSIGYTILKTLDIESWCLDIDPKKFNKRTTLDLDNKLQYPYYIDTKNKQLIFFSSREAMLANLYGDLEAFLKQYS